MPGEKRRSDRLMLTIPLTIQILESGRPAAEHEGRTVTLNRHGARILTAAMLRAGQTVRLVNLVGRHKADFRVVGPVSPLTEKGGEWGVECVDLNQNIWGIQFPPPAAENGESKALLECRTCHTVALLPVSLVEVEVLETSGLIKRRCEACRAETLWGHAERQVAMAAPAGEAAMIAEAASQLQAEAHGKDQRKHRRVALQLPVFVRDYYGGAEITRSENISKGGFCFVSEKTYHVGTGVMVVCPYNPGGQNIEVRARIVRCQPIEGTTRKIYGVRYDAPPA
jgi:hypothetical protein